MHGFLGRKKAVPIKATGNGLGCVRLEDFVVEGGSLFRAFAQSAKQRPGHVPLSTTSSAHADLKAVNAGNPQGVTGLLPRTFREEREEAPQREVRCGASLHVRGRSGEKPPSRPRIPCVYGLEVGGRRRTWSIGIRVPFAVSRFARKARYFGMDGERGCCGGFSLLLFRGFAAKSAALWDGRVRYCRAALSRPHF